MVERVKITITPSVNDSDRLTIQDAAHQLLDLFDLLKIIDKKVGGNEGDQINWCLTSASMNSPFHAEVSGFAKDPTAIVDTRALQVTAKFSRGFKAIIEEQSYDNWPEEDELIYYSKILKRNTNGIGETDIDIGANRPVLTISHRVAKESLLKVEKRKIEIEELKQDYTHQAYGSVEGTITEITTYHGKPSVVIRERLNDYDIHCVMDEELAEKIGGEHNWIEAWHSKRVIVEGLINYGADGKPRKVNAINIVLNSIPEISLNDVYDVNFTSGLSAGKYQDMLREGRFNDN